MGDIMIKTKSIKLFIGGLLGAALLTASGCSELTSCTEIGCSNDLNLQLVDGQGDPVSGMVGTVQVGATTYDINCPDPTLSRDIFCEAGRIRINNISDPPTSITVALSAGDLQYSGVVMVTVKTSQPNGPECEPTCKHGEVAKITMAPAQ